MSEVVSFAALSIVKGKGVTATAKVAAHLKNGADAGALIHAGVNKAHLVAAIAADGFDKTAHALSVGNIRPAAALVVAKTGAAVSLMEVNGKAPYSEWLRMGATLKGMAQSTKAGKPTAAAKGLALWQSLTDAAAAKREDRATPAIATTEAQAAEVAGFVAEPAPM